MGQGHPASSSSRSRSCGCVNGRRLGRTPPDTSFVDAILRLAGSLGLATVGEGIEQLAQLLKLRQLGCGLSDDGSIAVDANQATTVDRIYAAGNCADPRALVPAAAGSGATAAVAINARLSVEDADHAVTSSRAPGTEVR